MILVNKFIQLTIAQNNNIEKSFCFTTQNSQHVFLKFGLCANDCLFDLNKINYLISIQIEQCYFEKYNEPLNLNFQSQSNCCYNQVKLLDLINCKLTGIHRDIFLESTILNLLYQTQKNSVTSKKDCNSCEIVDNATNTSKMELAKKYILKNLSNPLTIPIIAAAVGTNQCYLKKGFKETFHQTIFEFIQENRMIKAQYLLQNSTRSITEISSLAGYASLSSFSQSYKNYFGFSPLEQSKAKISDK